MRLLKIALAAFLAGTLPASAANVWILQAPVSQTTAVPVLSGDGNTVAYQAGGASTVVNSNLSLACVCNTLSGATVTVSAGAFTGDTLAVAAGTGITPSYSYPTLTLSGTASIATYLQTLQNVTYSSSNADPTNTGANLTRIISFVASNGAHDSNTATTTVNVSLQDVAPILTASGSIATFTSGGSAVALDGGITITGATTLTSATIDIGAGQLGGDVLNAVTPGSLTQVYDPTGGTLTLTGSAAASVYQTAFRSIVYSSTLGDPTNNGANPTRTVNWTGFNNLAAGIATTIVNVQNPSIPTIGLAQNNIITYVGGGSPTAVNGNLTVTCTCVNLTSATLTISSGFFTGDLLAASNSFGITATYAAGES